MEIKAIKGVSLVVLTITVIVIAILATLIPITIVNLVDNAKIAAYIKDLEQIQDGVTSYIISNGNLEGIGETNKKQIDLMAMVDGEIQKQQFKTDLEENKDFTEGGINEFIEIDLLKIGIESSSTGLAKLGYADRYYVSKSSLKVYYPYGKKIGNETYFALTSRLTGKTNLATNDETSGIIIQETDNTIITKLSTNTWSNNIDVYVNTSLAEGESLRYKIGEYESTATSFHVIDSLPATITLSDGTMDTDEKLPWRRGYEPIRPSDILNQKITIERVTPNGIKIKVIYVNNLDIARPIVNATIISSMFASQKVQGNYNLITIPKSTIVFNYGNGGGADNLIIRYEYVNKINEMGEEVPYYENNPTIDMEYLLKFGKIANGEVLKLPENVSVVSFTLVDRAGNISRGWQGIDDPTEFSLRIARRANINWNTEYAKYTQDYFGRKISNDGENNYAFPPIPVGFRPVNIAATTVNPTPSSWDNIMGSSSIFNSDYDKGLVIEDMIGNQFVWVPVTTAIPYDIWWDKGATGTTLINNDLPTGVTSENAQIEKYKGFYIARYESAFDYNGRDIRAISKKSINATNSDWSATRTSEYNGYLFNFVTNDEARVYAKKMVNTPYVKSALVTEKAFDTTVKVISTKTNNNVYEGYVYNVNDSRHWGNYNNSQGAAANGSEVLRPSGYSEWWKAMNIYDLAGNAGEIINEKYRQNTVPEPTYLHFSGGGSYSWPTLNEQRATTSSLSYEGTKNGAGFRAMLFIID